MGVIVNSYDNREEWLLHRTGIGGSEAGAVCGWGFKTPTQLWEEKTGAAEREDLSDNERVAFGNAIEEPLRSVFRVMYPKYDLEFQPYTILRRSEKKFNFMFYTPDGWLTEKETGRKGLYESKSATCSSAKDWDKWRDQIPSGYYAQILHGMAVGDFEFAVLFAMLRRFDGDAELRAYTFERDECGADIKWLIQKETEFWHSVETRTLPKLSIQF